MKGALRMDTESVMLTLCEYLDLSKNAPLKDNLFDAFKKAIILGTVPAGTNINEKQLADALHISRTPIRAALNQLADEQLVDRKPGVGVIVRGISIRDANELFEIRSVLEALATTKAAHNMSESDFDELRALLEEGQRANAADDTEAVIRNANAFNDYVYSHAHSPRLRDIINTLQVYTKFFRNVSLSPDARRNIALEEHWSIYLAMRFGPDKKVEQAVRAHLKNSHQFVISEMRTLGID